MPQNRESGAAANKWGRQIARLIARKLGATEISNRSNEFILNGKNITIRCAHYNTDSVGVTYLMLNRIDYVIGAFEDERGRFNLYELRPTQYKKKMTETRSKGPSAGKVGIVKRSTFERLGRLLATV